MATQDNEPLSLLNKPELQLYRSVLGLKELVNPQEPLPHLFTGKIAITRDTDGVAEILSAKIKQINANVKVVTQPIKDCDVLIYLGGINQFQHVDEVTNCNREAFTYIQETADHLSRQGGSAVLIQCLGGDFGLLSNNDIYCWSGGLAGLAKTAALEWPNACVRVIDLGSHQLTPLEKAEELYVELTQGGRETEVGRYHGKRITISTSASPNQASTTPIINNDSVILVSGGARGITAQCLLHLAQYVQPTLVLLGRTQLQIETEEIAALNSEQALREYFINQARQHHKTPIPKEIAQQIKNTLANREVHNTMRQLQEKGCKVIYTPVDIMSLASVKEAVNKVIKQCGKITGIIHAAGVLADKLIAQKKLDDFDLVFQTKVKGLQNLVTATSNQPLQLLCCFSSVAGRYGNYGQSDYAMANEILNKVLQQYSRTHQSCLVKALNWGPWEGGMVTASLAENFKKRGISLIPANIGTALFVQELLGSDNQNIEVILGENQPLGKS